MRRLRYMLLVIVSVALFLPTTLYWSYYDDDMNRPIRERLIIKYQVGNNSTVIVQTNTALVTVVTPFQDTLHVETRSTEPPSTPTESATQTQEHKIPLRHTYPFRRLPPRNNPSPPPPPHLHHFEAPPHPIPYMGDYNCSLDELCEVFLTEDDNYYSRSCGGSRSRKSSCHFMNGTNRYPVALASFPGSGNTWVRGLLEKATGICTGSIYCDGSLRSSGMRGEHMRGGSVLVTKTHEGQLSSQWNSTMTIINEYKREALPFGSAILIVRNPFDALVAERTRQKSGGSHVRQTKTDSVQYDAYWVETYTSWWKAMITSWILGNAENKPLLVIRFEDLKSDWKSEVKKMLKFLQVPYSDEELQIRMEVGYTAFQRPHGGNISKFDHFTPELKQFVLDTVQEVCSELKKSGKNTYGMEEYLLTTA